MIHFITSLSHGSEQELNLDDFITVCAINVLFVYLVQCSVFPAEKRPVQAPRRNAPLIHLSISWRANNIYSDKLFVGRYIYIYCLLLYLAFHTYLLFGRPSVKRFALCYQTVVCLSVCNISVLWPKGWIDQDQTWHGGRPRPQPHCVRWGPHSPSQKSGHSTPSSFGPCIVAKRLRGSRCHAVGR